MHNVYVSFLKTSCQANNIIQQHNPNKKSCLPSTELWFESTLIVVRDGNY